MTARKGILGVSLFLSGVGKAEFVQVSVLIWFRMAVLCTICQYGIPTLYAIVFCQCFVIIKYILYSEEVTTVSTLKLKDIHR